ncbi:HAD-IA family hydrolase [Aurantimonas sp. MSK8Z-1]|uniref:HAD-IA family hydrolase n=1 Tax=Mangrovibrevibacter kandeliae TaxID=2968473 RepID=UPI002117410A|nr:HAD-IA family hydrolase [Aurantimonas sp. MSK8Z-1]MCW4114382.1 HAD-IA family hydrolase [Aurantimonas sp. MSK8Z-1]
MQPIAVFDLDGTLVDTAPNLTASLNHCLRHAGMQELEVDTVRPHAGHGSRAMLLEAYRQASRPLVEPELTEQQQRFLAFYEAHIAVASRPFPGAVGALDRLGADGVILAVCTNKTERLSRLLLAELGLAERFAAICGSDTFARRKPDPSHLLGTIERAGGDPTCAVMIGDTATDTETAKAASVPAILVTFGYDPGELARRTASARIESFDALDLALLHRLLRVGGPETPPAPPAPNRSFGG